MIRNLTMQSGSVLVNIGGACMAQSQVAVWSKGYKIRKLRYGEFGDLDPFQESKPTQNVKHCFQLNVKMDWTVIKATKATCTISLY